MVRTKERVFLLRKFPDRELELKDEYIEDGNQVREYNLEKHVLKVIKDKGRYLGKLKSSEFFFIPNYLFKIFVAEITYLR